MTSVRGLSWIGLAGLAGSTCCLALLQALHPELNPIDRPISFYIHAPNGWLLTVGLVSFGAAVISLAAASGRAFAGGSARGLATVGVLSFFVAAFHADPWYPWVRAPTTIGAIHALSAALLMIAIAPAAMMVTRAAGREPRWQRVAAVMRVLAIGPVAALILAVACGVAIAVTGVTRYVGLAERAIVAAALAWLVALATGLLKTGKGQP